MSKRSSLFPCFSPKVGTVRWDFDTNTVKLPKNGVDSVSLNNDLSRYFLDETVESSDFALNEQCVTNQRRSVAEQKHDDDRFESMRNANSMVFLKKSYIYCHGYN